MDQTHQRPPGPEAAASAASSPRKVGVYGQARERVRSGGMGAGVIVAVALLLLLWALLA
jgi:hypothetical protein